MMMMKKMKMWYLYIHTIDNRQSALSTFIYSIINYYYCDIVNWLTNGYRPIHIIVICCLQRNMVCI